MAKKKTFPECETLEPRWDGPVIVAATGLSLTKEVAEQCRGYHTVAIKQAVLLMPWADVLFACDQHHWDHYNGYPKFQGEKWSSHHPKYDYKLAAKDQYKLRLVRGEMGNVYSSDPSIIHFGRNTGFAAINAAIHWLRKPGRIVLIGLDFGGGYFYGQHPRGLHHDQFKWQQDMVPYEEAARSLPAGVEIVNCSPISRLRAYPMMTLEKALSLPKKAA